MVRRSCRRIYAPLSRVTGGQSQIASIWVCLERNHPLRLVINSLPPGPGELKLGLDVNNRTGLSLYRPGQQDLTVSVAENLIRPELPTTLSEFLQAAMVKPMIRRFDFPSLKGMYLGLLLSACEQLLLTTHADLHNFEAAVTGFQVLYDR